MELYPPNSATGPSYPSPVWKSEVHDAVSQQGLGYYLSPNSANSPSYPSSVWKSGVYNAVSQQGWGCGVNSSSALGPGYPIPVWQSGVNDAVSRARILKDIVLNHQDQLNLYYTDQYMKAHARCDAVTCQLLENAMHPYYRQLDQLEWGRFCALTRGMFEVVDESGINEWYDNQVLLLIQVTQTAMHNSGCLHQPLGSMNTEHSQYSAVAYSSISPTGATGELVNPPLVPPTQVPVRQCDKVVLCEIGGAPENVSNQNEISETVQVVLQEWFEENRTHPFPSIDEYLELSEKTDLSVSDIRAWLVQRRVLWKADITSAKERRQKNQRAKAEAKMTKRQRSMHTAKRNAHLKAWFYKNMNDLLLTPAKLKELVNNTGLTQAEIRIWLSKKQAVVRNMAKKDKWKRFHRNKLEILKEKSDSIGNTDISDHISKDRDQL